MRNKRRHIILILLQFVTCLVFGQEYTLFATINETRNPYTILVPVSVDVQYIRLTDKNLIRGIRYMIEDYPDSFPQEGLYSFSCYTSDSLSDSFFVKIASITSIVREKNIGSNKFSYCFVLLGRRFFVPDNFSQKLFTPLPYYNRIFLPLDSEKAHMHVTAIGRVDMGYFTILNVQ